MALLRLCFPVFSGPSTTIEVVENTGKPSSEKAGVGGSTPSLATIYIFFVIISFNPLSAGPHTKRTQNLLGSAQNRHSEGA
jgi:hypothetical protein